LVIVVGMSLMIARNPINIRSWHTVIQYPNQSFKDLFYESEEIYLNSENKLLIIIVILIFFNYLKWEKADLIILVSLYLKY